MTSTVETTRLLEENHCLKDAVLVKFFLNRIIKTIGVVLCIFAILPMINVITKFIVPGAFHKNIKIILVFYFFVALLQSICLPCCIFIMISHSFAENPCDVYLSRSLYTFGHLTNFYLLLAQINLQTLACIERVIATLSSDSYERRGASIGICFSLIALLSPLLVGYFIYYDADFEEPSVSVLITPVTVAVKMNACFMFGIAMCVISLLLVQFLRWYNRRKVSNIVGKFSCRFQTNENISTTSFIIVILMLQLLVYLIAGSGILFFRLTYDRWNYYDLTIQTIKTSLFLVPVFLFLLPLLTKYHMRAGKRQRKKLSFEQMSIKTTGKEGMENYRKVIYAQWN